MEAEQLCLSWNENHCRFSAVPLTACFVWNRLRIIHNHILYSGSSMWVSKWLVQSTTFAALSEGESWHFTTTMASAVYKSHNHLVLVCVLDSVVSLCFKLPSLCGQTKVTYSVIIPDGSGRQTFKHSFHLKAKNNVFCNVCSELWWCSYLWTSLSQERPSDKHSVASWQRVIKLSENTAP